MIRNTSVNVVNFFYPLGNTPAVSLTQDIPPEQDADILLLGCGDARSILFTCFSDRARQIDVTCCDLEAIILARNVLLLTLIIDDQTGQNSKLIWEIYYHWKIGKSAASLLEDQTTKLLDFSESADRWRLCPYASFIKFCDARSLAKVRGCWDAFKLRGISSGEAAKRRACFRANIDRAQKVRKHVLKGSFVLSGLRSASPVSISMSPMTVFAEVEDAWWQHGVTITHAPGEKSTVQSLELNPMFLYAKTPGLVLHYCTHPLEGFPLAVSFVPLQAGSPLETVQRKGSEAHRLVNYAQTQFAAWSQSFRKSVASGSVIRFFVGDALALALTLRNAPEITSNLFCDSWTTDALVLDDKEYSDRIDAAAPSFFDVIDTSNLVDHIGPINIMCVCADLLKSRASSILYTEVLVRNEANIADKLVKFLGYDARLIAFLLGLCPVDVYTNASNASEFDTFVHEASKGFSSSVGQEKLGTADFSGQQRSRLRWKWTMSPAGDGQLGRITVEPQVLTHILLDIHNRMFAYEDPATLMQDMTLRNPSNKLREMAQRSNPYYNRSSFVVLLASLHAHVETDWRSCSQLLFARLASNYSMSSLGRLFIQELGIYLQFLGDPNMRYREVEELPRLNTRLIEKLSGWRKIPSQLCVTLRIPISKVKPLTAITGENNVTAVLRCTISGGMFMNHFCALQVMFGQPTMEVQDGEPSLSVREDPDAWWGSSDMLVSTFVPTGALLMYEDTPTVTCGLLSTPFSVLRFLKDFGLNLDVFRASALSEHVFITRCMPGMPDLPQVFRREQVESTQPTTKNGHRISIQLDTSQQRLKSLTKRVNFQEQKLKDSLADKSSKISVDFKSPLVASIAIGSDYKFNMEFPVPVKSAEYRLRIARKSSYIEIEVPVWDPLHDREGRFVSPTTLVEQSTSNQRLPLPWTAVRVDLNVFPKIDLRQSGRLSWLVTHGSMMWSTRERRLRSINMSLSSPTQANIRVELKEGIYSILMQYTGVQGRKTDVFGLSKKVGGVQALILPASLRLDLVNSSVVIDAAVITLTNAMMHNSRLSAFLASLTNYGVMQIRVSDQELRSWKGMFPALAERCRTWSHGDTCEYLKRQEVPLVGGLDDGKSPICSCGIGKFPKDYLKNSKLVNLDYVLRSYATRMAISPLFPVPFVEDCFGKGLTEADLEPPEAVRTQARPSSGESDGGNDTGSGGDVCRACGKSRGHVTAGEALRVCGKCRQAKYCSRQCQRRDWKEHKEICSETP